MNLFFLHPNPEQAAAMHCDKHVVKMILETAQVLCTVVQTRTDSDDPKLFQRLRESALAPNSFCQLYKPTHSNHPVTVWCGSSEANFRFLVRFGQALGDSYATRFSLPPVNQRVAIKSDQETMPTKRHKSSEKIDWLARQLEFIEFDPKLQLPNVPPACVSEGVWSRIATTQVTLSPLERVLVAYRLFYVVDKRHFAAWNKSPVPDWFQQAILLDSEPDAQLEFLVRTVSPCNDSQFAAPFVPPIVRETKRTKRKSTIPLSTKDRIFARVKRNKTSLLV